MAFAAELTGKEVVRRYQLQDGAKDEVFDLKMTLVDSSGTERRRTATTSKKRSAAGSEVYSRMIVFHDPPEMARSGVLTIEKPSGDNDQWVYLPAYHTTRRIASENRRNYYMGTDFTYEDIYTLRVDDYEYSPVREESFGGSKCYVFEAKPSAPALKKDSGYSKTVYWIDSERYLILKAEFYDRDEKLLKIHLGSKPVKVGDKFRVSHQEIENLSSKHKTLVDYENFKVDSGLPDDLFTLRSLERGR
jgi:outer membrane lipoprotein-sorting protein